MSAPLVNISDQRFKRPNPERRAREERRFLAELADRSTPALAVRSVVATPEAPKRVKRRGKPQNRLNKKHREKKRCQATAQAPLRDVIHRPSPPSALGSAGDFKLPPLAPPKVPSWTSSILALNSFFFFSLFREFDRYSSILSTPRSTLGGEVSRVHDRYIIYHNYIVLLCYYII